MQTKNASVGDGIARAREEIEPGLRAQYPLTVRPFSEGPGEPLLEDAPLPAPTEVGTGLAAALERSLTEGSDGSRPGAIVLLSDGVQTSGPDPVPPRRISVGLPLRHTTCRLPSGPGYGQT